MFDFHTGQRKKLVIPLPEGEVPGHVINITCQPENDYLYVKTSSPMQPGPLYRCSLADENPTLEASTDAYVDPMLLVSLCYWCIMRQLRQTLGEMRWKLLLTRYDIFSGLPKEQDSL